MWRSLVSALFGLLAPAALWASSGGLYKAVGQADAVVVARTEWVRQGGSSFASTVELTPQAQTLKDARLRLTILSTIRGQAPAAVEIPIPTWHVIDQDSLPEPFSGGYSGPAPLFMVKPGLVSVWLLQKGDKGRFIAFRNPLPSQNIGWAVPGADWAPFSCFGAGPTQTPVKERGFDAELPPFLRVADLLVKNAARHPEDRLAMMSALVSLSPFAPRGQAGSPAEEKVLASDQKAAGQWFLKKAAPVFASKKDEDRLDWLALAIHWGRVENEASYASLYNRSPKALHIEAPLLSSRSLVAGG